LSTLFDIEVVTDYFEQHMSGKQDFSNIIWSMLVFEMWYKKYAA